MCLCVFVTLFFITLCSDTSELGVDFVIRILSVWSVFGLFSLEKLHVQFLRHPTTFWSNAIRVIWILGLKYIYIYIYKHGHPPHVSIQFNVNIIHTTVTINDIWIHQYRHNHRAKFWSEIECRNIEYRVLECYTDVVISIELDTYWVNRL
jgi:hypothetical protein